MYAIYYRSSAELVSIHLLVYTCTCRICNALVLECARPYLSDRTVWCQEKSLEWWTKISRGLVDESWWLNNLRMTRNTFKYLCREVGPFISKKTTQMREPISVERRVAVTIWRLATNVEYRTLAELFGLGHSTVGVIVLETCEAIAQHLLTRYVRFPQGQTLTNVVNGFDARCGFPQAAGAVDGTHIPIIRPQDNPTDYYNRKGYHSVLMQAVVDHQGIFTDIYIGWPGRVHDARVFSNSDLFQKGQNGQLLPDWKRDINGVEVPLVILGDPAYPLLTWLMKPYPEYMGMPRKNRQFNYNLSRARIVVEHAFGRLKGRWRCLMKRLDHQLDHVTNVIAACVVLHNICELMGDECQEEWIDTTLETDRLEVASNATSTASTAAGAIRDAFADYFV